MTKRKLDRILAEEETIVPTSGFLSSVMEQVSEEAAAPPPIPFPWKRAVPGMVLAAGAVGWGGYELVHLAMAAAGELTVASMPHVSAAMARPLEQAGWIVIAAAISVGSWVYARRMAGRL